MVRGTTRKDQKLLDKIREYETYSPDRCVQIWYEVRNGERRKFPNGFNQRYEHRVAIIRAFIDEYRKERPGAYPNQRAFKENKLSGLLTKYGASPYRAFHEAGFTDLKTAVYDHRLAEAPWTVLGMVPIRYWKQKGHRINATRWLVKELQKEPSQIVTEDFENEGIGKVIHYNNDSLYETIREAGYKLEPWEMTETPNGFWKSKENKVRAIRWMVDRAKKPVAEITQKDFIDAGMRTLIFLYDSILDALKEAGYSINPIEMNKAPNGFWRRKANRIEYTRWFVDNIKKPITKIDNHDFADAGLGSLLQVKNNSPYLALREAGYKVEPWQMSCTPHGYWKNVDRRRRAIRRLVRESGKRPEELITEDFKKPMRTVLTRYYGASVILALNDAGYDVDPIDMYRAPCNTWKDPENVRRAAERVSKETGKAVTELTTTDFKKNGYAAIDGIYRTPELQTILREGSAVSL